MTSKRAPHQAPAPTACRRCAGRLPSTRCGAVACITNCSTGFRARPPPKLPVVLHGHAHETGTRSRASPARKSRWRGTRPVLRPRAAAGEAGRAGSAASPSAKVGAQARGWEAWRWAASPASVTRGRLPGAGAGSRKPNGITKTESRSTFSTRGPGRRGASPRSRPAWRSRSMAGVSSVPLGPGGAGSPVPGGKRCS